MISTRKLIRMARKWQKLAVIRRKRILFPRNKEDANDEPCSSSSPVEKGHFVVYTADQRRFVIPLALLNNETFIQLLEMSEEEFGLPGNGPITLPCDAIFMEYIITLIRQGVAEELQKASLMSAAMCGNRCSSSQHQGWRNEQLIVY